MTEARIAVHRQDASGLLRHMPPRSIDALITDPPYATVDRHRSAGAHLRTWFGRSLTWAQIGRVLALGRSRLDRDGVVFVMTNQAGLEAALQAMRAAGFE